MNSLSTSQQIFSSRVLINGEFTQGIVGLRQDGSENYACFVKRTNSCDDDAIDIGDAFVVPAPLDLHFHGAGGMVVPPGDDALSIDRFLREKSTESSWRSSGFSAPAYNWIATLPIPSRPAKDPVEHISKAAEVIAKSGESSRCMGLRIEGLFLNPERAGVWPVETFKPIDRILLEELHDAAAEHGVPLQIVDIAPEIASLSKVAEFIERAQQLGIVISLAHTNATYKQALFAIDAGASLATHLWNAMRPLTHREPGVIGACLQDERVTCELICDAVHVHPSVLFLSAKASGSGQWAVISDASPFAGLQPGEYEWAGTKVTHDGATLRDQEGRLAGSASLVMLAIDVLIAAGLTVEEVLVAMGAVPRKVIDQKRDLSIYVDDPVWIVPN